MWSLNSIETLIQDLRYGARSSYLAGRLTLTQFFYSRSADLWAYIR
jgi:hypothetical protein